MEKSNTHAIEWSLTLNCRFRTRVTIRIFQWCQPRRQRVYVLRSGGRQNKKQKE